MTVQPKLKATRVLVSLLAGACVGATIFCIQYLIWVYDANGAEHFKEFAVSKGLRMLVPAFVIWLIALCLLGAPIWAVLHQAKRTDWRFLGAAGFIVPFILVLAMGTGFFTGNSGYSSLYANGGDQVIDGRLTPFGWKMAFLAALEYAGIGTTISLIIWWVNYRGRAGYDECL